MSAPVLELVDTGLGSSLQDAGRVHLVMRDGRIYKQAIG